jgi:hypothetical protein
MLSREEGNNRDMMVGRRRDRSRRVEACSSYVLSTIRSIRVAYALRASLEVKLDICEPEARDH